ncbi:putative phospholipid metabolism enzyme regulator protein [Eutypa lata UCREL1]|uniref:Putative phospholipid metabolism enzyme regulator protein n=1 Tax=Eutypa lata (strain UCR-EL1) TaxID=1287681 RepID=M7TBM1_EUTLA|nr:putative phospholipid metabolism enzyme regulator protein [Eutypa lata UCREL1]
MRTPARGPGSGSSPLETVQEVSQPNSPNAGLEAAFGKLAETAAAQASSQNGAIDKTADKSAGKSTDKVAKTEQGSQNTESGSDSGSVNTATRRSSTQAPPPLLHNRQSSTALKFGNRGQTTGESSSRNMTVETEKVENMQKLSLAPNVGAQGANGSLRTKPSNETIKPKKEKKKHSRKPAAVSSGTASSKADIFEAKVASAVEEANSSDSDETFVYDSNPPDVNERPRRFHSRTPSAASMASQADRNGMRSIHSVLESGTPNVPVKKNMKFVNTFTDIKLVKIGNVLASEQELMMDISVKAHNPNVVVVMVDSADLEIFAKSPHAGTDSDWWRHPDGNLEDEFRKMDDPIDDPPNDDTSPNMRLGNILEFDSPLSYEGSFFQSGISVSTGSLRLARPGNGTTSVNG